MLDGTEMLFGSASDLDNISQQSVSVRTIDASNFFDRVEICQAAAIKDQVIPARDFGDSIDRETDRLVDGDGQIQREKRNGAQLNDGRGQNHQRVHAAEKGPQRLLEEAVFQVLKKAFRSMRFGRVGSHVVHLAYSDARGVPLPPAKRRSRSS